MVTGAVFAQGPVGDADGDGVRDLVNAGEPVGNAAARGFVDEDNDGVNDRYLSEPDFVDLDGDGAPEVIASTSGSAAEGASACLSCPRKGNCCRG